MFEEAEIRFKCGDRVYMRSVDESVTGQWLYCSDLEEILDCGRVSSALTKNMTIVFTAPPTGEAAFTKKRNKTFFFLIAFSETLFVCRHFVGTNLNALNSSTSRHLQALLKGEMPSNQKHWKDEELFDFSYRILFK